MGYYSAIKYETNVICINLDGPRAYHIKLCKSNRKSNIICYHLYVESENKYKWTDLQNRNRPTDIEDKFSINKGEWWDKLESWY